MKPVARVAPVTPPQRPAPYRPGLQRPPGDRARPERARGEDAGGAPGEGALPEIRLEVPAAVHAGTDERGGGGGQGDGERRDGDDGAAPEAAPEERAAVVELGDLVAAFCLHPAAVDESWSIRIPLDSPVLAECVLVMHVARQVLHLRFETARWETRAVLRHHAGELVQRLQAVLGAQTDIDVTI